METPEKSTSQNFGSPANHTQIRRRRAGCRVRALTLVVERRRAHGPRDVISDRSAGSRETGNRRTLSWTSARISAWPVRLSLHHLERRRSMDERNRSIDHAGFPGCHHRRRRHAARYVRALRKNLWEAARISDTWQWLPVSIDTGAADITGTPSASLDRRSRPVHARMWDGSLGSVGRTSQWRFTNVGGIITGPPVSARGGAHERERVGGLWLFNGGWISRGGILY